MRSSGLEGGNHRTWVGMGREAKSKYAIYDAPMALRLRSFEAEHFKDAVTVQLNNFFTSYKKKVLALGLCSI